MNTYENIILTCSGVMKPFNVTIGCSGSLDDLMNNRSFEESPKIYGEEDKMKLEEDNRSFWKRWWK